LLAYYWDLRHGVITQQAVKDLFPAPSAEALWAYPHHAHDPHAARLALPSQHKIWLVPFVNGDHAQAADAFLSANVFPDMGASLMPEERLAFHEELRKHMGEAIEQFQRSATDILRVLPEGEAFTGARSLCHRLLSVNIPTGKDKVLQELASLKTHKDTANKTKELIKSTMDLINSRLTELSKEKDIVIKACKHGFSIEKKEITETLDQKIKDVTGETDLLMKAKEAQSFWERKASAIDEIICYLDQGQLEEALILYESDLANLWHEGPDFLRTTIDQQRQYGLQYTAHDLKKGIQDAQKAKESLSTIMAQTTRVFKEVNHNLHDILFHHQRVSQMLYMHSIGKQLEKEMEAEPYEAPEISNEKVSIAWIQMVMDREITKVNGLWQSFCALGKDWQPGQGVKAEQGVFQATEPRDGTEIKHWKEFEGLAQDL
jgi:hypothetical protein